MRRSRTDEQYRVDILAKIMRNISSGTYDSVINAISFSFGCKLNEIEIKEADEPCTIESLAIPLDITEKNNLSQEDIINIIEQLLPVGVGFKSFLFTGTFEFGAYENEVDENKGFSDDAQVMGGYFGNIAR